MNIYFASVSSPSNIAHNPFQRPNKTNNYGYTPAYSKQQTATNSSSCGRTHACTNEQAQAPVNVTLQRENVDNPWGFRVQGGCDYKLQLTVCKTQSGSPSEGVLQRGDAIKEINGQSTRNLSHEEATDKIRHSGKQLQLIVNRGTREDLSDLRPQGQLKFNAP